MEASRLRLSINLPSDSVDLAANSKANASAGVRATNRQPTLHSILSWIERQDFPPQTKKKLVKQAKSCPNGALKEFIKRAKNG